jgi:hypothetical protein
LAVSSGGVRFGQPVAVAIDAVLSGRCNQKPRTHADCPFWGVFARAPALSPITTVGRYATVEEAQVATDEVWAADPAR